MHSIAIVGAGHAGLQLGIGLCRHGYDVTILTDRTAEEVRDGRVLSSQGMQRTALRHERMLGLAFWDDAAPRHEFIEFSLQGKDGGRSVHWRAPVPEPGNSVCQRVKVPRWMAEFEALGGTLEVGAVRGEDLDGLAQVHDLVVVATGKGEIGRLFTRNDERSPYNRPMRTLALTYVAGMAPSEGGTGVVFNAAPEVGEYFVMPGLTTTGRCDIMVFEGLPGGPMDCWRDVATPADHLGRSLEILERFFPWEAARCRKVELTDENGILAGAFPPTVRDPVAELPSGSLVLGIADTVMLNDPLTGQGSNNASKFAWHYLHRILDRGDRPFDRAWMVETFESYWRERGRLTTEWSNRMLLPPTPDLQAIIHAAEHAPAIARRFVECFDHPPDFFPWLFDRAEAERVFGPLEARSSAA